jgi:hypothetical protein
MVTEVRKITESRKAQRDAMANPQDRQAAALEQIADTLEAIRSDMIGTQQLVAQIARNGGPGVR